MNNPCYKCEKRGCGVYHDICPDYQKYRNANLKDYEKRKQTSNNRLDLEAVTSRNLKIASHYYKKP